MRIGIDLDGVLLAAYDTIKEEYDKYKEKYPEMIAANNKLIVTSDHTTLLNGNVKDFGHFFDETYKHYYRYGMVQEGAREFIERLKNEGHQIYIVTSRTSWEYEEKAGLDNIKNWTRE